MSESFIPGDDLVFQLESGFGLVRVLAVNGAGPDRVWHLLTYEELFPDIESAEQALKHSETLHVAHEHLPLTERAFERTPAAKLLHRPITQHELSGFVRWQQDPNGEVFDRSLLQLLGMR